MSALTLMHPEQNFEKLKEKGVSLCAFLDKTRVLKDGTFTLRLRIINNRLSFYYSTKISISEIEYLELAKNKIKSRKLKDIKIIIYSMLKKANDIIIEMNKFDNKNFKKLFFNKRDFKQNVNLIYNELIEYNTKNNSIGNANNYKCSLNSLLDFESKRNNKKKSESRLIFENITSNWLMEYEKFMLANGKTRTSISMYLRALRSVFNYAIRSEYVKSDTYPFGRNKYKIPSSRKVNKALDNIQLKCLFNSIPKTNEQEKAKDFWFFSYCCNGMNINDIARLKYENIIDEKIVYYRTKTINTNKSDLKPIVIYLNEYSKKIIEKYGNNNKFEKNYIFNIINSYQVAEEQHTKIKNFTRFINQNIKKLASSIGLDSNISTYWARHSFSTISLRKGVSIEFISEALGHNSLKTTQNYISGFDDKSKKEFSNNLMMF